MVYSISEKVLLYPWKRLDMDQPLHWCCMAILHNSHWAAAILDLALTDAKKADDDLDMTDRDYGLPDRLRIV